VEDVRAALRVSSVVEVSSLRPHRSGGGSWLTDSTGRAVPLIDPPALLAQARSAAQSASHPAGEAPDHGNTVQHKTSRSGERGA
jgi:hypothetical protein